MILSCTLVVSFSAAPATYALSVDPLLDKVISVTQVNKTEATPVANNNHGLGKTEDKSHPATSKERLDRPTPISDDATLTMSVVAEPLETLPSIDMFDRHQRIARISEPTTRAVESPAVMPVAAKSVPSSILRSSDHGWRIFGVAWYVWGLAGIGSTYATRWVLSRR